MAAVQDSYNNQSQSRGPMIHPNGYQQVPFQPGMMMAQPIMVMVKQEPWADAHSLLMVQQGSCADCCLPICCLPSNRYDLYKDQGSDEKGPFLGSFREESNCVCKWCCRQFRPWTMRLEVPNAPLVIGERGCFLAPPCQCCCCCRETIQVSADNQNIGKVYYPKLCYGRNRCCYCPHQEIDIYDQSGNMKYYVSSTCCQTGLQLRCFCCCFMIRSCGPCRTIEFDIFDANTKDKVGVIQNVYNGVILECFSKADKYSIEFPSNSTFNDKVLINFAALMVDYNVFEDCLP